ncbi:MAG: hypothetical protein K5622_02375, partial [Endomicrobiaceae bacterium]|nr:hypothetical protein [Endomicrobiaceae bacterium]
IKLVVTDKTTHQEYEISIIKFGNLKYMNFFMEIKGDSDREKFIPLLNKLAQEIMKGKINVEVNKEINEIKQIKTSKKIYYDESKVENRKASKNIIEFFDQAEKVNKTKLISVINEIFADGFEIQEDTVNTKIEKSSYYPTKIISFIVTDKNTQQQYKISLEAFVNITSMEFSVSIEGDSDRTKYISFMDKIAKDIMNGKIEIESEKEESEEIKPIRKEYYDENKEKIRETSKNISKFFNFAETNKTELISAINEIFSDTFEIQKEKFNIKRNDNYSYYPTTIISFYITDKNTQQQYKISLEVFININSMNFNIEVEGDSEKNKCVPFMDKLAQAIMSGNLSIENIAIEKEVKEALEDNTDLNDETESKTVSSSRSNINQLKREIIKAGKNNRDIVDFIKYLKIHKLDDYELLDKILTELKKLDDWEIPEYCSIIHFLKTKENIYSFFKKSKPLQLNICDLYTNALGGYDEDTRTEVLNVILSVVDTNKYTSKDFDFLFEFLLDSRLIVDLETKENMYDYLTLDIKKRRQIYDFYMSSRDVFGMEINKLSLELILFIIKKYRLSQEQLNYLMKLIYMSDIADTTVEKKYIDSLKDKEINLFVFEKIQKLNIYDRYLLDLLFSDIEETYINDFDSKLQRMVDLFDKLE